MKTKQDYAKERLDPRWQKKRLQIMERDDFKCQKCKSREKTLNVHHLYYISGRVPWVYPDWSLATLCRDCHTATHNPVDGPDFELWESMIEWLHPYTDPRKDFAEQIAPYFSTIIHCVSIVEESSGEGLKRFDHLIDCLIPHLWDIGSITGILDLMNERGYSMGQVLETLHFSEPKKRLTSIDQLIEDSPEHLE